MIRGGGQWTDEEGFVYGDGLYEHYQRAISLMWPFYEWHRWSKLILRRICENDVTVFMGSGDSNKTYGTASFVLTDWWVDPWRTLWMVSSTTKQGADLRIWGKIKDLFNYARKRYPWLPGFVHEARNCIVPDAVVQDQTFARTLTKGIVFIPCFPKGTMVDTPYGPRPIEKIHMGDVVNGALGPEKVLQRTVHRAKQLVRIALSDGRKIDCTPEHKFFTEQGWIAAIDLKEGIRVFSTDETLQIMLKGVRTAKENTGLLLPEVPDLWSTEDLSVLRKEICSRATEEKNSFLFSILLGEMDVPKSGKAKSVSKIIKGTRLEGTRKEAERDYYEKSDRTQAAERPYESNVAWRVKALGWLWSKANTIRNTVGDLLSQCRLWVSGQYRFGFSAWKSAQVCDRFCVAENQTGGGSGRALPPVARASGERQQEGSIPRGTRVESVTVLKPAGDPRYDKSRGGYRVYNLEITRHPSYSVNGVVVHNCKQGDTWLGLGDYAGIKPPKDDEGKEGRMGHAGDEVSLMHPTFLDAYANWYGKAHFRGILDGNPGDLEDPLCTAGEPECGWEQWKDNGKTQEWRSKFYDAWVVALDGRDSPNFDFAIENGKVRYPYLIGPKKINAIKTKYGENDWHWWNQCVGKPSSVNQSRRILTRVLCDSKNAFGDLVWKTVDRVTWVCALDAAYGGVGGDRCIIRRGAFGEDMDGNSMILSLPPETVPVSVKNTNTPEDQIAEFCKQYCESWNIPAENFFFDGRSKLAVVMARVWSPLVNVVDFAGPASSREVTTDEFKWKGDTQTTELMTAKDLYFNFVSELWFTTYYLIHSGQLRGFDQETAKEMYKRSWDYRGSKIQVEPKPDMKKRTLESPDLGDAFVVMVEGCRRLGFQIALLPSLDTRKDVVTQGWLQNAIDRHREFQRESELSYS